MAGNAVLKRFSVDIDLKSTLPLEPFEVVDGDSGNVIDVTVTDGGTAVLLEDMLVTAVFQSPKGTRIQDSADGSIALSGNTAEIALLSGAVSPGLISCELQLRSSTLETPASRQDYDVLVTTARFSFNCRAAMLNDDAVQAMPETPLLDEYLNEAYASEAQRAAAESARVQAENARAAAETERAQAESARAAAETERQTAFEAMLAAAIGISKTGSGAPTGRTEGSCGQLYFDLTNKNIYVCTAVSPAYAWRMLQFADGSANSLTLSRNSSYLFENLPYNTEFSLQELAARLAGWYMTINGKQDALEFDEDPEAQSLAPVTSGGIYSALHASDWKDISVGELLQDASNISINCYSSGLGTGGFSFDELRLILVGEMVGSGAARVFVNGNTSNYMRFATFAYCDTSDPTGGISCVHLKKPNESFAFAERICGGDTEYLGYTSSIAVHSASIKTAGLTAYTAIKVAADGPGAFAAGTKVILQGRNIQ